MSLRDSFKSAWTFINSTSVAPWVLAVIVTASGAGFWQATVGAQERDLEKLEKVVDANKEEGAAARQEIREDLLKRLDAIDHKLDRGQDSIDRVNEKITDLQLDVAVICKGKCRKN